MHEHSLMAGLMKKLEAISRQEGGGKMVEIHIKLGALSHISPEHFREHFEEAARGTCAQDARLNVVALQDTEDPMAQEIVLDSVEMETE